MKFDSRDAHEQKISPDTKKNLKIIADKGLEVGQKHFGKKEDDERTIIMIIYPMFAKTKDTTYESVPRRFVNGKYRDATHEIYHTPFARGTSCVIDYKDADGKFGKCSPAEFVKWMAGKDSVPADVNMEKGFPKGITGSDKALVASNLKANKDRVIMPGMKFDEVD